MEAVQVALIFAAYPVWGLILYIIEKAIQMAKRKLTERGWHNHSAGFEEMKNKHNITEEAKQMENIIKEGNRDFAILVHDVSKLYKDSNGYPIYAVNQVSLGIKTGCLFGFLGSNGAGKTTLMKMILGEEPHSNGFIEIEGKNIDYEFDQQQIAICPQFDDHLSNDLTGIENLKFFCKIYNKTKEETKNIINMLVNQLDVEEHKDKLHNELSGGNRRKFCVAVAFLSDAPIILLDEPTSSLDPIARHKVHQLINRYKGQKTFMLCTHLLDEAESLCDEISIMLNGCVYTIGTPTHLSDRFGTEWKVDVILNDPSEETNQNVTNFFAQNLPNAKIVISRELSRIYSVPSASISITKLFRLLEDAKAQEIGIKYYTCSCSTLEKVFQEIVMLSEQHQEEQQKLSKALKEQEKK